VFENRVPRRIFWPRRNEVTGEWRKLHNEELNNIYSSPNIFWVIKSGRIRWAGHIARMGKLHNEELNNMYSSPNIFWVIKSGRIKWAGHIARMGKREAYTGFW
jgi:hypothetical protein